MIQPWVGMTALAAILSGCLGGTMLDGRVCTFADSDATKASLELVMAELPEGKDKDRAQMALELAALSATVGCEAHRALEAQRIKEGAALLPQQ